MLWINIASTMYVVCMNIEVCAQLLLCMFEPFAITFLTINDSSMSVYIMLFIFSALNRYDIQF
jgi:hypothetical protein